MHLSSTCPWTQKVHSSKTPNCKNMSGLKVTENECSKYKCFQSYQTINNLLTEQQGKVYLEQRCALLNLHNFETKSFKTKTKINQTHALEY